MTEAASCAWCGRAFIPRVTGGKQQVFCRPVCRRGFDAAGRRWVAEAIADGTLTLDALRNGSLTTGALLLAADSPPLTPPAGQAAEDDVAELLDDLLLALLEVPDEEWFALMDRLPGELVERLCDRVEAW